MAKIKIESILGGHAPTSHFAKVDQFRACLAIDPAQPIDDSDSVFASIASGLLRPAAAQEFSGGATLGAAPLWMIPNPKNANLYIYDALGSAYSAPATFASLTALADAGELSNSLGNGGEYYDNYIYLSKSTTVARYGPLDGTPLFNGDYWVTTLGKTALSNTTYPTSYKSLLQYPNHFLKRHSDGRLYLLDVVGNQGYVHYIKTTKTTVEGDTNSGSTYGALTFGYGLWPICAESFGADLAIAFYEGSSGNLRQARAKIAFWDTTSTNFNKIIWVEYPDTIITAMKNVNGVLYVVSGNVNAQGWRLTRFLGGYQFEEVYYSETGEPCLPGAIDAILNQCLVGTFTTVPEAAGVVIAHGLQKNALGRPIIGTMRATGGNSSTVVTAVLAADNNELGFQTPVIGWSKGSGVGNNGLDRQGTTYNAAPSVWWSQTYRVGSTFRISSIRIPFAQAMAANMTLNVTVYTDDGSGTYTGATYGLPTLNNTTLPNGERFVSLKTQNIEGFQNFFIELRWTGSALLTVNLPIEIDFEVIDEG